MDKWIVWSVSVRSTDHLDNFLALLEQSVWPYVSICKSVKVSGHSMPTLQTQPVSVRSTDHPDNFLALLEQSGQPYVFIILCKSVKVSGHIGI